MSVILYNEKIDFSKQTKVETTKRIDFASVCCWKLFDFELFELWLIDDFWLIADKK